MASPLDGLIFDALYGSRTLSSLFSSIVLCQAVEVIIKHHDREGVVIEVVITMWLATKSHKSICSTLANVQLGRVTCT